MILMTCPYDPGTKGVLRRSYRWTAVWTAIGLAVLSGCQAEPVDADDDLGAGVLDAGHSGDEGADAATTLGRMRGTRPQQDSGGMNGDGDLLDDLLPAVPLQADAGAGVLPSLVTSEHACELQAERACARLRSCSKFLLQALYGKEDACRQRTRFSCLTDTAATDTGWKIFEIVKCAQSYDDVSCPDLLAGRGPAACQVAGKRPDGMPCGTPTQCQSGHCDFSSEKCGVCGPRGMAGHTCTPGQNSRCLPGHVCGPAGRCIRPGSRSESCDPVMAPCESHLACITGRCTDPLPPETPCKQSAWCNQLNGQTCIHQSNAVSGERMCRMAPIAQPNDFCGEGDEVNRMCTGGPANCRKDAFGTLRCVPPAKDGETCGSHADGRTCIAPARCIDGRCRLGALEGC